MKLTPGKTTGKQAYKVIARAIKDRSKSVGHKVRQEDFCDVSGLSRQTIHNYRHGRMPTIEGLSKIASGLRAWGIKVEIVV